MGEKIVFQGGLYRVSKDRDGEVKITFSIPKTEAGNVMNIPEETGLTIAVVVNG